MALLRILAFAALVVPGPSGNAQYGVPSWGVRHYTVTNGLPQSSVRDLVLDSLGFLWVSTDGGLLRFDGSRMVRVEPRRHPAYSARSRWFCTTADGSMYMMDGNGNIYQEHGHTMLRLHATGALHVPFKGQLPNVDHLTGLLTANNPLRIAAGSGPIHLMIHPDERWSATTNWIHTEFRDSVPEFRVSLPKHAGFCRVGDQLYGLLKDGHWVRLDRAMASLSPVVMESNLPIGPDAYVLGDHRDQVAFVVDGQRILRILPGLHKDALLLEDTGILLPILSEVVAIALLDSMNTVAVGTNSNGLFIYHKHIIRVFDKRPSDRPVRAYYSQVELPDGRIAAVNSERNVVLFDRTGDGRTVPGLEGVSEGGLVLDPKGRLLLQARGWLLGLDPSTMRLDSITRVPPASQVFLRDGDSTWIANDRWIGYLVHDNLRIVDHFPASSYSRRPVQLARDPEGRLLLATCDLVMRTKRSDSFEMETVKGTEGLCARALTVIGDHVWIGTYGNGLWLLDKNDSLYHAPNDRSGYLEHVHAIVPFQGDQIWLSTNRGLVQCGMQDLLEATLHGVHMPYYAYFGVLSGMSSGELNGGCSPSYLLLSNGDLALPAMQGLVILRPPPLASAYPLNAPLLDHLLVNGQRWPLNERLTVDAGNGELSMEVSLPYWGFPGNVQLEYRVATIDPKWHPVDLAIGRLIFARPPSGDHILELRLVGASNREGATLDELMFHTPSPWMSSLGGVAVIIMGLLFTALIAIRWNNHRLTRRNEWLQEKVNERTVALDDRNRQLEHALAARESLIAIVSHDIVTPLDFIARVGRGALSMIHRDGATDQVKESMEDLCSSAAKLHSNASAVLDWIRVNPDRIDLRPTEVPLAQLAGNTLDLWLESAEARSVLLENLVPEDLAAITDRSVLSVILNNLVGNAVNHASLTTRVRISAERTPEGVQLNISDNGTGMDTATRVRVQRMLHDQVLDDPARFAGNDGQGIGYAIVAQMAHVIGASMDLQSGPKGTSIGILLPDHLPNGHGPSMDAISK